MANVTTNLINFININKPSQPGAVQASASQAAVIQTAVIFLQAAVSALEIERAREAIAILEAQKHAPPPAKKLLSEVAPLLCDDTSLGSELRRKKILGKINIYFEDCFDNVSLAFDDQRLENYYFEFVRTHHEMEYGYCYLAFMRYFSSKGNYELVLSLIETIVNKYPDSKYEFLALADLLEIYRMEFTALDKSGEDSSGVLEKIIQVVSYLIKNHSYQRGAFEVVSAFAPLVFRHASDQTAKTVLANVSAVFTEPAQEEEIKLAFANYFIGRGKFDEARSYLVEFLKVFPDTPRRPLLNVYMFECCIGKKDHDGAYKVYKALDDRDFPEGSDRQNLLYSLVFSFGRLLEERGAAREALSVYERIYKITQVKKLREESLYKLITQNVNYYLSRRENIPEDQKIVIRGYCNSFQLKFPKSLHADEVKLVSDGLNQKVSFDEPERPAPAKRTEVAEIAVEMPKKARPDQKNAERKREPKIFEEAKQAPAKEKEEAAPKSAAAKESLPARGKDTVPPPAKAPAEKKQPAKADAATAAPPSSATATEEKRVSGESRVQSSDSGLREEGPDYLKTMLYAVTVIIYLYFFIVQPTVSLTVFYVKMVLSYFPVLLLVGVLFYSLFRKIGIFD